MKSQTISLCMIVKDEERTLDRCLASVKDFIDEMIIIDTGSTDNTIAIAKKHGAQVHSYKWCDDFADARNFANQFATSDYILSLDGDEWISEDTDLSVFKETFKHEFYYLNIRNLIQVGVVENHSLIRLFKRGFSFTGSIHEQIDLGKYSSDEGGFLSAFINHDGYMESVVKNKNKKNRNRSLLEKEIRKNPTAFNYYNLGNQYRMEKHFDKAIELYRKSFSIDSNKAFTHKLLVNLVQCLFEKKKFKESLDILKDASEILPMYTDYYFYIGLVYEKLGYLRDAEANFIRCVQQGEVKDPFLISQQGVGSYMAHALLAKIYLSLGEVDQGWNQINLSIKNNPLYMPSFKIWMELHVNASHEDIIAKMNETFNMRDFEQISAILKALYQLRSPLLLEMQKIYNIEFDDEVHAWTLQVSNQFQKAKEAWNSKNNSSQVNRREVMYLSVVTKDIDFYKKHKVCINIKKKDHLLMEQIIRRESITAGNISPESADILEELFYDILTLKQYDVIEYFMINVQIPSIRFILAEQLKKFNFLELALDSIIEPAEQSEKYKIYSLAGDVLSHLGRKGNSYYYLDQARSAEQTFEAMFKIFNLALSVGDSKIKEDAVEQLKKFVPESPWAQTL
ncbi:glycosyltransferase [Paenibacillus chitinolyticus]|uniref:glycosyltransferase n=1 Tax=Paenibacillus chitinolyticus TaxID=79263 RepID=UPI001C47C7F6|nr:glycosyltransferase [Paenibacillus chitinolyticus]MBV6716775.1 glycosyltransferase [Paenibacillus chitinolyticus]